MTSLDYPEINSDLLVVAPSRVEYNLYSSFQYPWFCLNYLIIVWVAASLSSHALSKTRAAGIGERFLALTDDKRRNVITYVIQLILTSIALVLQVGGSWEILIQFKDTTSQTHLNWMVFAIQTVSVLYVWELVYRLKIGLPLLSHHLITLLLSQLSTASFFDTQDIFYIRFAILLGFYATTEQLSFLALFCFRLEIFSEWHRSMLFYAAAFQAFFLKTAVTIVSLVYFCVSVLAKNEIDNQPTNWKWFWRVCFLPLLVALYASQLYACKILLTLKERCAARESSDFPSIDKGSKHDTETTEDIDAELQVTTWTEDESSSRDLDNMEKGDQVADEEHAIRPSLPEKRNLRDTKRKKSRSKKNSLQDPPGFDGSSRLDTTIIHEV